jgi:hypothetical protein
MNRPAIVIVVFAAGISASLLAQPRRDGKWEVKMDMEMPGMPMKIPTVTSTQCITPEEASDPQKTVPQGGGRGNQNCKVSDYKTDGNKVTYSMKCDGKDPMTGSGEFIYGADSYTGTMKIDSKGQAMTMKYSGKRLGDCSK